MKIICTVCSKNKSNAEDLLPARLRYSSPRITTVKNYAEAENLPYYFLSGKFGLICENEMIPYCERVLTSDKLDLLIGKVVQQIRQAEISDIIFYAEARTAENWGPYHELIEKASATAGVNLEIRLLK